MKCLLRMTGLCLWQLVDQGLQKAGYLRVNLTARETQTGILTLAPNFSPKWTHEQPFPCHTQAPTLSDSPMERHMSNS